MFSIARRPVGPEIRISVKALFLLAIFATFRDWEALVSTHRPSDYELGNDTEELSIRILLGGRRNALGGSGISPGD